MGDDEDNDAEYVCEECGQLSGRTGRDALHDITGYGPLCRHCYEEREP